MFKRFKDGNDGNDGKWAPHIPWPTKISVHFGASYQSSVGVHVRLFSLTAVAQTKSHTASMHILILHFQSDIDLFSVFYLLFAFLFIVFIVGILLLNLVLFLLWSILFTFRIYVRLPFEHTRQTAHSNQAEYTLLYWQHTSGHWTWSKSLSHG